MLREHFAHPIAGSRPLGAWLAMCGLVLLLWAVGVNASGPAQEADPTADPCASPTLTATGNFANVRSGPDVTFELLTQLQEDDTRPILGRHWEFRWWQIEMSDGSVGWIWDGAVELQGNIAAVPVISATAEDEVAEATWEPIIETACTSSDAPTAAATFSSLVAATPEPLTSDSWSIPDNLSQSGAAANPQLVANSTGVMHVLWQEAGINRFLYVRDSGLGWSQPTEIEVPFGTALYYPDTPEGEFFPVFRPELVIGDDGRISAFWIDEEGNLQSSRLESGPFDALDSWTPRESLAGGVLKAKAMADAEGRLHLAYMRSEQSESSPAGIYYRQYDEESGWAEPILIHQSLYFQAIEPEQARLQIAGAAENEAVFVAWDNPLLEQVFVARSADRGLSWQSVLLVDSRELQDTPEAVGPSNVVVGVNGSDVLLLWQAGHEGNVCAQYYVWSSDSGETWQPRRRLEPLAGCAHSNQLLDEDDQPIFLLSTFTYDAFLLAWNGEAWSEPRSEDTLVQFVNPETNQSVALGCQQAQLRGQQSRQTPIDQVQAQRLAVVGCGQEDAQDIWFLSRSLGIAADWFPPPRAWNQEADTLDSDAEFRKLDLIADPKGRLHLLWTEEDSAAIYHAVRDGNWSQPLVALASPDGTTNDPSAVMTADGNLLVVWSDLLSGKIYFSAAAMSGDVIANSWLPPVTVTEAASVASAPDVAAGADGTIYVSYAVPLNEGRGIYLTESHDEGKTWSTPSLIYDASPLERAKADEPELIVDSRGQLHLMWQQLRLPGETDPYALYYTHSLDGGESWSSPELVLGGTIRWSALVSGQDAWLYRIWQVSQGEAVTSLQVQSSQDGGRSWSDVRLLANTEGNYLPAAVTVDRNQNVHLFHLNNRTVQHWIADGQSWNVAEPYDLPSEARFTPEALAAAVDSTNTLFLAYAIRDVAGEEDEQTHLVQVAERSLGAVTAPNTISATAVAQPPPTTATASPTPSPMPTPTLAFSREFSQGSSLFSFFSGNGQLPGAIAILIPAALTAVVIVALALGIRKVWPKS